MSVLSYDLFFKCNSFYLRLTYVFTPCYCKTNLELFRRTEYIGRCIDEQLSTIHCMVLALVIDLKPAEVIAFTSHQTSNTEPGLYKVTLCSGYIPESVFAHDFLKTAKLVFRTPFFTY